MNRLLIMLALTALVSCATAPKDEITAISRPFTSIDAGQRIILSKNRTFEIKLPSNPGSGYDWVLRIDNPKVVSSGSHRYNPDRSGRKGLGGETMWTLRTRSPGNATLTYLYQNETNTRLPASRTVTFMIGVR
jgi:predicted secreted protein